MLELLENVPELLVDEREIVISRVFEAPRAMVYEAFADPKQMVMWWGPRGFRTTVLAWELRVGGSLRIVMHGPDGTKYPNEMTFTEVVPQERVAIELMGGREGEPPIRLRKMLTWEDEGDGTRFTLRNQFASRELRDENVRSYGSVEGGRDLLERLSLHLTAKR